MKTLVDKKAKLTSPPNSIQLLAASKRLLATHVKKDILSQKEVSPPPMYMISFIRYLYAKKQKSPVQKVARPVNSSKITSEQWHQDDPSLLHFVTPLNLPYS